MKLSITHLTFLNLNLIHVIDCGYHDGVTVEEVKSHIKNGDVLDWLGSRFKGRIDPGCTYATGSASAAKIHGRPPGPTRRIRRCGPEVGSEEQRHLPASHLDQRTRAAARTGITGHRLGPLG